MNNYDNLCVFTVQRAAVVGKKNIKTWFQNLLRRAKLLLIFLETSSCGLFFQVLQIAEKEALDKKRQLNQERYDLQRRLAALQGSSEKPAMIGVKRPRHSEGESSTSSVEIDVENDETGYASSESEDRFSIGSSTGSDGGLTANSRRV